MTDILREPVRDNEGLIATLFDNELFALEVFDVAAVGIDAMTIVGKRTKGALTQEKVDVVGANKGAIALEGFGGGQIIPGVYVLTCVESDGGAGKPAVFDIHLGTEFVGQAKAGVQFIGPCGTFTKAVGAGDAAGDNAQIIVEQAAGDGKIVRLAPAGSVTDGTDEVYGIAPRAVAKSAGVRKSVVITEFAVIADGHLTYPAGADANAKAAINAALRAKHIKIKATQVVG